MSFIEVDKVGRRFGGLRALNNVSFTVSEGEIVGIMGANGAGKTTLFNVMAGYLPPSEGTITLRGKPLSGMRPDQVCRQGVGRTFQIVKPFKDLTVLDNTLTAAFYGSLSIRNRKEAIAHCEAVLEALGIFHLRDAKAHTLTLSGQKKLEVARAVCTGCKILMLDEVMAGLTPTEVSEMLAIIQRLHASRGLTILIIEHVMRALMQLSERIIVLHHGELIATGTPEQISVNTQIHEIYFGEAR